MTKTNRLPRPTPGEDKYLDYDLETDFWGIFGEKSGFCYGQYGSEEEAQQRLELMQHD